jgi:methionine-rich copper-binding protein CopC
MLLAGLVTAVSAHDAVIIKSIPANGDVLTEPPSEVAAWFAEELVSGQSTMTVFSAQGTQIDNGDGGVDLNDPDHASLIVTLPPLSDGSYTVQWHVTLLDGDASDGAFAFAVGEGQSVIPAVAPAVTKEDSSGPSGSIITAVAAGLVVLLFIGVLAMRRRQS